MPFQGSNQASFFMLMCICNYSTPRGYPLQCKNSKSFFLHVVPQVKTNRTSSMVHAVKTKNASVILHMLVPVPIVFKKRHDRYPKCAKHDVKKKRFNPTPLHAECSPEFLSQCRLQSTPCPFPSRSSQCACRRRWPARPCDHACWAFAAS